MNPHEAQASLDDIARHQDRTRDAYVAHGYSRPYVYGTALAIFIMFASFDLSDQLKELATAAGLALLAGLTYAQQRRAPVRRRPSGRELLFSVGAGAVFIAAYVAFAIAAVVAALKLDMPAHHTVAAAAIALAFIAAAGPTRRAYAAVVRKS